MTADPAARNGRAPSERRGRRLLFVEGTELFSAVAVTREDRGPITRLQSWSLAERVSLSGRRAVVTGAARALGRAVAARMVEACADVLLADLDAELAAAAAKDLGSGGPGRAVAARLDATDAHSVVAVADPAVRELGGLGIWINNAGVFPSVSALEMSGQAFDEVFDTRGVFLGSREAARRMSEAGHGGVIVNVVSTAGFRGTAPGLVGYVGSKHAARGITRQLALQFAPFGIRVLGVAPTFVPTGGNLAAAAAGVPLDFESIKAVLQPGPLGRPGVPDDIARVVLFCASDLSAFMTGSMLLADAGETA